MAALLTLIFEEYIDATIIAFVFTLNAIIGTLQEYRAERSMEAQRRVATARAHVEREGHEWEIDSTELVPGDIVILEAGSRVPADCRLVVSASLEADESLITGESATVAKGNAELVPDTQLADRSNMLFMASIVTRGRGRAVVVATGASTQIGRIAGTISETAQVDAPIIVRMARFARIIAALITVTSLLAFAVGLALRLEIDELFLTLVAMMVAAIPEGLPDSPHRDARHRRLSHGRAQRHHPDASRRGGSWELYRHRLG